MRFVRPSDRRDRALGGAGASSARPQAPGAQLDDRARRVHAVWVPLARELLKLAVIAIYLAFATWLTVAQRNPAGFAPLLPWALGAPSGLTGLLERRRPSASGEARAEHAA